MRNRAVVSAALLLLAAGCARCSPSAGPAPERFLPSGEPAIVVPRLGAAQDQARPLVATVLSFAAAADLAQTLQALREQLGFDPLDAKGLEGAGLDLARGAALSLTPGSPPLLVLPVGDRDRLDALVARLARDRLGAGERGTAEAGGAAVTIYRAGASGPPALSLLHHEGTALVTTGADGPALVAAAAARARGAAPGRAGGGSAATRDGALADDPAFVRARAALWQDAALVAFAPPAARALAGAPLARDGVALGVSASGTRLAMRGVVLLPSERHAFWRETLAPAAGAPAAVAHLPADAFLVGRYEGDLPTVARRVLPLSGAAAALRRSGMELERDLLGLLAPGAAAAVSLAPTFEVAAASRASQLGAGDPFRLVHVVAALEVKDGERTAAALDRLARSATALGLTASAPGAGGPVRRWRFARGAAELELALEGRRLLVGGGAGRLDALLAGAGPAYAAPSEASRRALSGGAAGGVVDFGRLVASFRALPPQAYGTGPDAFVMRSLADRLVEPASRLVAASARLDLADGAAVVDLTVEARPAGAEAR
jgi:hypothetical protein